MTPVKHLPLFILFIFSAINLVAQTTDFTSDSSTGCARFVTFTNTSSGFSAAAKYAWNFGNGITKYGVGPQYFIQYQNAGNYSVTLTVTDGNNTPFVQTKTIEVYKRPSVNFTANTMQSCTNNAVTFTSASVAGDGTIANYTWEFGDGNIDNAGTQTEQHSYTAGRNVNATLTVTNSYGCDSTLTKNAIVVILTPVNASFKPSATSVCSANDSVSFTNSSTGPGTLTYKWDFGDNITSTAVSPSHVYGVKGAYTVTLTATGSAGCSAVSSPVIINVASSKSNIAAPTPICQNASIIFTDNSNPQTYSPVWLLDNTIAAFSRHRFSYTFTDTVAHKLQLINIYGACSDTAVQIVKAAPAPALEGFLSVSPGKCALPATVQFNDTTGGVVKWQWDFNNKDSAVFNPTDFTQQSQHTYAKDSSYFVALKVTSAQGCSAAIREPLAKLLNDARIVSDSGKYGCKKLYTAFSVTSGIPITQYGWTFSDDNSTSNIATPTHTFLSQGVYTAFLNYVNKNGCSDTTSYKIYIGDVPKFDFGVTGGLTSICGNTPVNFTVTGTNTQGNYFWNFGDANTYTYLPGPTFTHKYYTDSNYTVSLVINNDGCVDTVIRPQLFKVLPPFPRISYYGYDCNNRGVVTLRESTTKTDSYSWDFGDGSPLYTYTTALPQVTHQYAKTKQYKVVLAANNGSCTVKDSVYVYALLNQKPILSAVQTSICASDTLKTTISGMDASPYGYNPAYKDYTVKTIEYNDGTLFTGSILYPDKTWINPFDINLKKLDQSKDSIRMITVSRGFNCLDTTKFLPVQIHGPIAGFSVSANSICVSTPAFFIDNTFSSLPLTKWQWDFGDSASQSLTAGGNTTHLYAQPGSYLANLTVTDKDNCSDTAYYTGNQLIVNGPKSYFTVSQNPVSPNTPVSFYNEADSGYNSHSQNTYIWFFGDGSSLTNNSDTVVHTYKLYSDDTAMLIAKSTATSCIDTAKTVIHVKNTDLSFTYVLSYFTVGSTCPPMLAKFTNTSINFDNVTWNFGDGETADNNNAPSHKYAKPGIYKVTLFGYYNNSTYDSVYDFVTIPGSFATLKADTLFGCNAVQVMLTANVNGAGTFTWDFGDGTLSDSQDTFAVHQYTTPGIYTPAIILKSSDKCVFPYYLNSPVIIDSMQLAIKRDSMPQCHNLIVNFSPIISSIALNAMQPIAYTWNFGTGKDSSNTDSASFTYHQPNTYVVTLTAASPYGCRDTATKEIVVKTEDWASIISPAEACAGSPVVFKAGQNNAAGTYKYLWQFNNGATSAAQNPPPQTFQNAGKNNISLIVAYNGCNDTAYQQVTVFPLPVISVTSKEARICLGDSVQLLATGGVLYTWTSADNLRNAASPAPYVSPVTDAEYKVSVTDIKGCMSRDSVNIMVSQPIKVTGISPLYACNDSAVTLHATGAYKYQWIAGTGLSDVTIANPQTPAITQPQSYTVVGYDEWGCFTDTAIINVQQANPATIYAGADITVIAGIPVQINTVSGADVVRWNWQPNNYLNCNSCSSPIITPRSDVQYVVQATTNRGCKATDTLSVHVVCKQGLAGIPEAFSPNNDGLNDRFHIGALGIKSIQHIVIYGRNGNKVFERRNINPDDRNADWDGTFNNYPMPTGTYVYMIQLICDAGDVFNYKGVVVLLR